MLSNGATRHDEHYGAEGTSCHGVLSYLNRIPLNFEAGLPAEMLPGEYEASLNLPDPNPLLADRPDYSIRLANDHVWEDETGFNRLLH